MRPDTSMLDAYKLLSSRNFDGMPVVDNENHLVGIVTEYDLLSKDAIHLPTLQTVLQHVSVHARDRKKFNEAIKEFSSLTVQDIMNDDPLTVAPEASFEEVVALFRDHHRVNPIPVIDNDRTMVGVVSRYDVLKPLGAVLENRSHAARGE